MAKRVRISIEIDVELAPGYAKDQDVKASLQDAVEEWNRREWRHNGNKSQNGDVVKLQYDDEHDSKSGQIWGIMKASWNVYTRKSK